MVGSRSRSELQYCHQVEGLFCQHLRGHVAYVLLKDRNISGTTPNCGLTTENADLIYDKLYITSHDYLIDETKPNCVWVNINAQLQLLNLSTNY